MVCINRAVVLGLVGAIVLAAAAGCSASSDDVTSDGANIVEKECGAYSPQFDKIRRLVEPLNGRMGSYAMTLHNTMSAEPLLRGPQIFGKMADLIAEAEEEVRFQTWRWDNDGEPAKIILAGIKRLEERRRTTGAGKPPVVVRMLINKIAFSPSDQMTQLGKRIEDLKLDPKLVDIQLAEFVAVQAGANHAKTLIVDSKKAVLTGTNASSDNAGPPPIYWDAGYLLEGEVARGLHNDFAGGWADGEMWNCGSQRESQGSTDPTLNEMEANPCRSKPKPIGQVDVKIPAEQAAGLSCVPIMIVGHKERTSLLVSDDNENAQTKRSRACSRSPRNASASKRRI